MNKSFWTVCGALLATAAVAWAASTVTVSVKQTSVRSDRQFFAPTVATAKYQDKLAVSGQKGDWYEVTVNGKKGYVHASAVGGGAGKKEGSSIFDDDSKEPGKEDVALAGKGFNPQVEKEYKSKNPKLDFAAVDAMEKITVSDAALATFASQGNLSPKGGN
ncbi:MAG: hypothetical protein HQK87_09655 [Nitrospinae bacterium]|nr:hypothetical protein [Nitrospinota bacterium]